MELDTSRAIRPNKASLWILQEGIEGLSVPLVRICSKSVDMGELPDIWKTANVVPIFKAEDRQEVFTYRPVSLTCIPCNSNEHYQESYRLVGEKLVSSTITSTGSELTDFVITTYRVLLQRKRCETRERGTGRLHFAVTRYIFSHKMLG